MARTKTARRWYFKERLALAAQEVPNEQVSRVLFRAHRGGAVEPELRLYRRRHPPWYRAREVAGHRVTIVHFRRTCRYRHGPRPAGACFPQLAFRTEPALDAARSTYVQGRQSCCDAADLRHGHRAYGIVPEVARLRSARSLPGQVCRHILDDAGTKRTGPATMRNQF